MSQTSDRVVETKIPARMDRLPWSRWHWLVVAALGTVWILDGLEVTIVGAFGQIFLLNPNLLPVDLGWRLSFAIGAVLGLVILFLRRTIPESPRWLMIHGHPEEAERIVDGIEERIERETGTGSLEEPGDSIAIRQRDRTSLVEVARTMFQHYPRRSLLGLSLMVSQAFFYNALFFTYALVLSAFYGVPSENAPYYLLVFAIGNFLGPLVLGHLFDTVGRRPIIAATYALSAVLLAATAWLFAAGVLTATTQTICWAVIFFIASASASSAYLTVSEVFPLETRALAIAIFYSIGTGIGGICAPVLFGALIGTKQRLPLTWATWPAPSCCWRPPRSRSPWAFAPSRSRWRTWPHRWPRRAWSRQRRRRTPSRGPAPAGGDASGESAGRVGTPRDGVG